MRRMRNFLAFGGVLLLAITAACSADRNAPQGGAAGATPDLSAMAQQVVAAFQAKDGEGLARLVHPDKGVRFSPYAFVDLTEDQVFSREQVARFWQDPQPYLWGYADGSGDPIELSAAHYIERYVMDRDFAHPTAVGIDADRARSTTDNNVTRAYPQARRVELYVEPAPEQGDPTYEWAALRLVFEPHDGVWYLIGVIHDEWTT
jgi:hypothetical protein